MLMVRSEIGPYRRPNTVLSPVATFLARFLCDRSLSVAKPWPKTA